MKMPMIVIGNGQAGAWAKTAESVLRDDVVLLARARQCGLIDLAAEAGFATPEGELLEDTWLVVADVDVVDLSFDRSVIAHCWVDDDDPDLLPPSWRTSPR